jgi:hypothetical protein
MKIQIDPSALSQIKWYEYAIRFIFGGLITAITGNIAKEFGPVIGGLFLAFPAIFPAAATLIEKHEKEKKEKAGLEGTKRAAEAVGADAAGAAIGTIGLSVFALMVWQTMPTHSPWLVRLGAMLTCIAVAAALWGVCKRL